MADPRLNGDHLGLSRIALYGAAVEELLDCRGSLTATFDQYVRRPAYPRPPTRRATPSAGGAYTLVSAGGLRHTLRVGINAIGRYQENDLVLEQRYVSRRHCVILVHATGGCEVYDTASRNGTWINGRRVGRSELLPGDILGLAGEKFLVEWAGPPWEPPPRDAQADTAHIIGASSEG
jgi:pSer/pThr/pTyr-binding forkhead associated (FHA) protein